mgnify:CR=1 FL=1
MAWQDGYQQMCYELKQPSPTLTHFCHWTPTPFVRRRDLTFAEQQVIDIFFESMDSDSEANSTNFSEIHISPSDINLFHTAAVGGGGARARLAARARGQCTPWAQGFCKLANRLRARLWPIARFINPCRKPLADQTIHPPKAARGRV